MQQIFIISDGTGGTAERALKSAIAQFGEPDVSICIYRNVLTTKKVTSIISEAARANGFIIHTVVSQDLRNAIGDISRLHNVKAIDLMGPILSNLTNMFAYGPSEEPGLFRKINKEYFSRIEGMEFAFRHDDGLRSEELDKADIVLIGVSRTFKTPLSIFLAFKGWMVGNIPIINNLPIPDILNNIPPEKVICLTTDAYNLVKLRQVRHDYLGGATGDYAEFDYVRKEIAYARNIYIRHPNWSSIIVTNKPIEEIAGEIIKLIRNKKLDSDKNNT